jgi:DNA (cytosine-5)-methyltransferase 1
MESMTVGSLFSGIGGLELGFERAGFQVAWQVEIDEYCRRVLAKHWPDVTRYEDIRTVGAHNLAPVDVLVGGFPCQDISIAGKGVGIDGARSGLWAEYARLISELRPAYAVVENVPALLHRGLGRVLGDLADCGYDAEWDVLSAGAFGAPHRRRRLFLVGYSSGQRGSEVRPHVEERQTVGARGVAARVRPIFDRQIAARLQQQSWLPEPPVGRLAYGISRPVAQWRGIGNAVVPQVAQYVAKCVLAHAQAVEQEQAA